MVPYLEVATTRGKKVKDLVDQDWMSKSFIPSVQQRGGEIIKARGFSSAASAANAAIDHMRTWAFGTNGGWTAMGVESDGSYGIPKGLNSSFPVIVKDG
jgi:malate dehydrogenase